MLGRSQITKDAIKILERAAKYRHKGFRGSEEFKKCYMEFCEATGNRDTSANHFKVYVLKYGVRDKMIYTKEQGDLDNYRADMVRKIDIYREDLMRRSHHANK